jgi:hypothetical protein
MAQATNEQLLEAARSGDYSAIMNTPDRYGQIPANMNNANEQLRNLQNAGAQLLKQENAMKGITTGDYSGATRDAPIVLEGSNYDRVFNEGKGYAVYDSFTTEDGTQYLAVAGKNSSFIQKINPDGTTERVASPPKASSMGLNIGKKTTASGVKPGQYGSIKSGTRGKNINRVLGAFEDFKSNLDTKTDGKVDTKIKDDDDPIITTTGSESGSDTSVGGAPSGDTPLDSTFSGADFTPVTPSTDVINIGAGEVAPIDPNVSQTVNQAVGGVNYQPITPGDFTVTQTTGTPGSVTSPTTGYVGGSVSPQANVTGTFTQPASTAGMSAVPGSIMYKTQYAGTQGAVPQGTVATAPGTGQNIQTGYEQHPYINKQTTQEIMVTEFNGQPVTYIPPGFVRKFPKTTASTQATSVDKSITGVAAGGDIDRDTILAKRFLGFEGSPSELEGFLASNPGASSRMNMYRSAMDRQNPNVVPNEANIAGQPHRLAYVNPEEEKLLEAAGGAGVPSYGGIPAYFTGAAGTVVGETFFDNDTGTIYTWNGNSWDVTSTVASRNQEFADSRPNSTGPSTTQTNPGGIDQDQFKAMQQGLITQTMQPRQAGVAGIIPNAYDFIPVDAGMAVPQAPFAEAATAGSTTVAGQPILPSVQTASTTATQPDVERQTDALTAQTLGTLTRDITGQTQDTSSVSGLGPVTGAAQTVQSVATQAGDPVPTRTVDLTPGAEELVQGTGVDQTRVGQAFGTGEVQAASVQDELASLMSQFEGGNTPAWAAGSMRRATAVMAERGLGASSLAGQAIVQAAMEAALPIAQIDAGNKQQVALFKAEQRARFLQIDFDQAFQAKVINAARVSEIANMNFNADQQIALENSRAANTMNLANLNNRQALLLSEAAALANLDMANLSNLQQAQVQNAQNFLQMDMANLTNRQQTEIFKTQQNIASILSDSAADNAAEQFNAQSENQRNQFFSNLSSIVSQFNASQANAMDQFNLNNVNSLRKFNSEMQQQRDLFNAQNGLVIAQANAKWRQNISTLNTAAQNESNMDFAKTINALSAKNLDEIWQRERDIMSNAFVASQSAADRALQIVLGDKELEGIRLQMEAEEDIAKTKFGLQMLFPNLGTDGFTLFP